MLRVSLKFFVFLLTLSLPVYQNAHVDVFARRFIPFDVYCIFSVQLVTFINAKGNIWIETLILLLL